MRRFPLPYIKDYKRSDLADRTTLPTDPGELNYVLTHTCNAYLEMTGTNYSQINEVIGALECAKLEFYRRIAVPYEDKKLIENGDVYSA